MRAIMKWFRANKRQRQAGDTIVEVLICIAIISAILAGAYVTTRHSQMGVQDSQEHAQAQELLQSQVEQLRASKDTALFKPAMDDGFCMSDGAIVQKHDAQHDKKCVVSSSGSPANGQQPAYTLSVSRQDNPDHLGGEVFTVNVDWPEVTGDGTAHESMVYRSYNEKS
jgi:type II secretory pathway component PulJ